MPKIIFNPGNREFEVTAGTKILAAALRNKIDIQYGCAACRCGTCGIEISVDGGVNNMDDDEVALLGKMGLDNTSGKVRLACRTKVSYGDVTVDLDFQSKYSPDQALDEDGLPK